MEGMNPIKPRYVPEGSTSTFHGAMYQLRHFMLIIQRASQLNYDCRLLEKMEVAAEFDDLVFEYGSFSGLWQSDERSDGFLKFKHRAPETGGSETITARDLLNENYGDFSLLKYFKSFIEIDKHDESPNKCWKDYVLCTNLGIADEDQLLEKVGIHVVATDDNDFLAFTQIPGNKERECYRLKAENNPKLYELLKRASDTHCLGKVLAEHVCQNTKLTVRTPIFHKYHRSLKCEVIDIKSKRFRVNFIDPAKRDNLSEKAKKFRDIFLSHVKKSAEYKNYENDNYILEELEDFEFQLSTDFGKGRAADLPDDVISDENIRNFFARFIIAVDQPGERQLNEVISKETADKFDLLNVDFLVDYFEPAMLNWFKDAGKRGEFLTAVTAEEMYEGIRNRISTLKSLDLSLTYVAKLDNYNIELRRVKDELETFLGSGFGSQKLLELSSPTYTLLHALRVYHTIETVERYERDDSYVLIELEELKRNPVFDVVSRSFDWSNDLGLLIVDCGINRDDPFAQEFLNSLIGTVNECHGKKLILISQKAVSDDAISFRSLNSKSQRIVLEKPIKVQGSEELTNLSELLEISDLDDLRDEELDDLSKIINSCTLVQLIRADKHKPVPVGSEDKEWVHLKDYYVPRTLIRDEAIDLKVVRDWRIQNRFAITGIKREDLLKRLDIDSLENCFFLGDRLTGYNFDTLCTENKGDSIHWLHYSSGKFIWKKTRGNINKLKSHRNLDDTTYLQEEKLLDFHDRESRIVVIEDSAGTGKSTVLTYLAGNIRKNGDPPVFVIRINLNQFQDALDNQRRSPSGLLDFLVENSSGLSTDFERRILKTIIKLENRVVIMLEGLDQLELEHRNLVIKLLKKLRVRGVFVTAIPGIIGTLQQDLETYSYRLKPFAREDQIAYLFKFWSRKSKQRAAEEHNDDVRRKFEKYAISVLDLLQISDPHVPNSGPIEKSGDHQIKKLLGVPMLTKLAAEVFEYGTDLGTEKIDVIGLFDRFIDKKLRILVDEKNNDDGGTRSKREKLAEIRGIHQELALKALFRTDASQNFRFRRRSDEKAIELYSSAGIFTLINNEMQFSHKTYAEYLAAQFFFGATADNRKCKHQELRRIFEQGLFVRTEYRLVRAFLNGFLEKSPPKSDPLARKSWKLDLSKCCDKDGRNAYHVAAEEQSSWILELISNRLVEEHKGIDAKLPGSEFTPLHLAARHGTLAVVKFLLENGADVNSRNDNEGTPLHLAASRDDPAVVKCLLENGADVNSRNDSESTPLHVAGAHQSNVAVVKFLLENGADVNSRNDSGSTPFHVAASNSDLAVVKFLLENGADVNSRSSDESTPLHRAASGSNLAVVKFLLENGADVNSKAYCGSTPLHRAASFGNLAVVKFLVKNGADVNPRTHDESTPLHWAASLGNLAVVKFLVENGADVKSEDFWKRTPLDLASSASFPNTEVKTFLEIHLRKNLDTSE